MEHPVWRYYHGSSTNTRTDIDSQQAQKDAEFKWRNFTYGEVLFIASPPERDRRRCNIESVCRGGARWVVSPPRVTALESRTGEVGGAASWGTLSSIVDMSTMPSTDGVRL